MEMNSGDLVPFSPQRRPGAVPLLRSVRAGRASGSAEQPAPVGNCLVENPDVGANGVETVDLFLVCFAGSALISAGIVDPRPLTWPPNGNAPSSRPWFVFIKQRKHGPETRQVRMDRFIQSFIVPRATECETRLPAARRLASAPDAAGLFRVAGPLPHTAATPPRCLAAMCAPGIPTR